MNLSFENTKNAFLHRSNADLQRSYWLFKMLGNSKLVNFGARFVPLAFQFHLPVKRFIKATIYKQFVGGETIQECTKTIGELQDSRVGAILDYSVEGQESEESFEACKTEIIHSIHFSKSNPNIPFCVFKMTGLARFSLLEKVSSCQALLPDEQLEWERVKSRFNTIVEEAHRMSVSVLIDAEESWIQDAIDTLVEEKMKQYNKERAIVYNTFQMYRKDRLSYLQHCYEKAKSEEYFIGAKLVRGAYMEKEQERANQKEYSSPIYSTKQETDQAFDEAISFCLSHLQQICICAGTHNENSCSFLVNQMKTMGLKNNDPRIYFSQLLGMSDHISFNLSSHQYNVAKYVPYGPVKDALPYLIRRAKENTSVEKQTGRELSLIAKEKKRRSLGRTPLCSY